jgi:CHASE1-domain containing sensor protein
MGEQQPLSDMHKKQRRKNLALLLALFGLVVVVYLVTIVRMGGQ